MQEQNVEGQETPKSSVLKRLESWASSKSGWSDRDSQSGTFPWLYLCFFLNSP